MTDNEKLVDAARAVVEFFSVYDINHISDLNSLYPAIKNLREALPVQLKPCPAGHEYVILDSEGGEIFCDDLACPWSICNKNSLTIPELIEQWNRRAGDE